MSINLLEKLPGAGNQARQLEIRQLRTASRIWAVVAGLILVASVVVPSLLNPGSSEATGVGVADVGSGLVLAGPFLCALFCALTGFSLTVRLSGGLAGLAFQVLALAAGIGIAGYPEPLTVDWVATIPLLFFAICLPFLLARFLFGWQIHFSQFFPALQPPRISVGGLMIFTAAFAFCAAALSSSQSGLVENAILVALGGIGAGMVLVVSAVLMVMRSSRCRVGFAVSSILSFPLAVTVLWASGREIEHCLPPATSLTIACVTINICLVAARRAGGRILDHSRRDQQGPGLTRSLDRSV